MPPKPRTLDELVVDADESAWTDVEQWITGSNKVLAELPTKLPPHVIVPLPSVKRGEESLLAVQVTTRSPMGAVVYNCSKLKLYGGWITIIGAGCGGDRSYSLGEWSAFCAATMALPPALLLIGYDAMGGFFFLNGGALPRHVKAGNVCYLAPDAAPGDAPSETLIDFGVGYSDFLHGWALQPDRIADFYADMYFEGWEEALLALQTTNAAGPSSATATGVATATGSANDSVTAPSPLTAEPETDPAAPYDPRAAANAAPTLDAASKATLSRYYEDRAFGFYPFLWTGAAADMPIRDRSRKAISLTELFRLRCDVLGLGATTKAK